MIIIITFFFHFAVRSVKDADDDGVRIRFGLLVDHNDREMRFMTGLYDYYSFTCKFNVYVV